MATTEAEFLREADLRPMKGNAHVLTQPPFAPAAQKASSARAANAA
jgi:hypothetical protein